ncbi:unnamed protein product [Ixodes pacificus]
MRHVGVGWIPLCFGVMLSGSCLLTFVWAMLRGDVTPYVPFVSEAGADPPQSGFFSLCLFISVTLGLISVLVRFQTVQALNAAYSKQLDALNGASALTAVVSCLGMASVAAFPLGTVPTAHAVSANVLFFGMFAYQVMQTVITFWMFPSFNGRRIFFVRLTITTLSGLAVVIMGILSAIGKQQWYSQNYTHPLKQKQPSDEGFPLLVASATFEWLLGLCLVLFFFTFVREFHKVTLEVKADVLVEHMDDEPIFRKSPFMSETTYLRAHET